MVHSGSSEAACGLWHRLQESGRLAARLVDKIIKGEKPAVLAVESNPRIELVINLKVAKALGLSLAPSLVQRATRVIE